MSEVLTEEKKKTGVKHSAFINGKAFEFIPGESILNFIRRNMIFWGACLTFSMSTKMQLRLTLTVTIATKLNRGLSAA